MNDMEKSLLVKAKNDLILENLRVLCVRNKTSIPKVEKELGYGNGSISGWKKAKKLAPQERVQAIADYFNVPIEALITENGMSVGNPPEISDDNVSFPVIGGVAAGYDHICYQDWTGDTVEIPRSYLHGRDVTDYFVLRVEGDSMYPDYQDGDHVLVQRQDTMDRSGQVGVVIYGDENATLKRIEYVYGEDWMKLCPINPQYPPVTIRDEALEHCTVLGVARMVIRKLAQ
jgi:SOS-response transcriptional repressor LexA